MAKVMIDPGHGPGSANRGPTGYYEYQGMWALSNHLKAALERSGVKVGLTRKENENPTVANRGKAARGYDLFISEHSNAFNGSVRGCEVFYSLQRPGDRKHAAALSATAAKLMDNNDRGPKTRRYSDSQPNLDWYGVIRNAVAVGCKHVFIAESGFHDNRQDEAWLKQESNLQALAEAQAEVICGILDVRYVAPGEDGDKLFRVQVGAFAVKANADSMFHRLKADGYDAYMVKSGLLYRVQTGAFAVKSNADNLAKKLKADGYEVYITTKAGKPATPGKAKPEEMRVGDKVRVKKGAKTYTGGGLAAFVYTTVYDVIEVRGDRVVIGLDKAVTAAMHVKDLIKQ